MQTNRRHGLAVAALAETKADDKVRAIRESLIELKSLTAADGELRTLTYMIGMALQEASHPKTT
ncbi:hypothetical protein [Rhizobium sp.]